MFDNVKFNQSVKDGETTFRNAYIKGAVIELTALPEIESDYDFSWAKLNGCDLISAYAVGGFNFRFTEFKNCKGTLELTRPMMDDVVIDSSRLTLRVHSAMAASMIIKDSDVSLFVKRSMLSGLKVTGGNLAQSKVEYSDLSFSEFLGVDLRGTRFNYNVLARVKFEDCDLRGVDFRWSDLTLTSFVRCNLLDAVGIYSAAAPESNNRWNHLYAALVMHDGQLDLAYYSADARSPEMLRGVSESELIKRFESDFEFSDGGDIAKATLDQHKAAVDSIRKAFTVDMLRGRWNHMISE